MKTNIKNGYDGRIEKVLNYIDQNLDDQIVVDQLAEVACFSKYHFSRIFQGMVGETVAGYVRRLKLERAAIQIINSANRPITEFAFDSGYETVEAFTKAFRKLFGVSPKKFRTQKINERDYQLGRRVIKNGGVKMKVEIKKLNKRKVAYVRHVGPYKDCGVAWEQLCSWAGPRGLIRSNTSFLGLSYDDPSVTPADKIRYDACITVDESVEASGEVMTKEIEGGEYITTIHKGPFDNLHNTYIQLCGQWAPQKNIELQHSPSIEIYLNDPEKTPPEELLIEIQCLIG